MQRLLVRRRRHGLSWRELSEKSGVPAGTLQWWDRRLQGLGRRRRRPRAKQFAELVATPETPSVDAADSPLEIVLSRGCRIVVRPGFDVEHLRRVVEALGT